MMGLCWAYFSQCQASDPELVSAKVAVEIRDNLSPKMQTLAKANAMTKLLG
jgi:hypothetical protein